ncbi:MAG: hypothetical protein KJ645_14820, partial [Planctomycetes bacterium]|nr:hypothetical protein [Planctomycetota bacterium]
IVTPYTAMLVLEDERNGAPPATPTARLVREAKKDEDFNREVTINLTALGYASGEDSVRLSKATRAMQSGAGGISGRTEGGSTTFQQAIDPEKTFKQVHDKTFVLVDGVWYDSRYQEGMDTRKVPFLSEDYFALIQTSPQLAQYLSVGDRVVVLHQGEAIEITGNPG